MAKRRKKKYRATVTLPFKVGDKVYQVGDIYETIYTVNIEILTHKKRIK